MSNSSSNSKIQTALDLLLSGSAKPIDIFNHLLAMPTDDMVKALSNAGVIINTPAQIRHELLRGVRDQLRDRPFFKQFDKSLISDTLTITEYVNELQSIARRFVAARDADIDIRTKRIQISALQISLVKIMATTIVPDNLNVDPEDVFGYAKKVMESIGSWLLNRQKIGLNAGEVSPKKKGVKTTERST